MTLPNLLLILFSACIHVVAHIILRKAVNRTAALWWVMLCGQILFVPILFTNWQSVSPTAWVVLILSAVFEAGYYLGIARAYSHGDEISVIYPLARGTAPILLLIWVTLFLREPAQPGGALGVIIIALGLYLINLPRLGAWREPLQAISRPGPRWALFAGFCISCYSVIDRVGVTLLNPLLYTYIVLSITWLMVTPVVLRQAGWGAMKAEFVRNRLGTIIAGITNIAAYAIVLYTVSNGTPASYAGAIREVSVVLGVLIGILFLGEKRTVMKVVGAASVAGGVVLIKLLG
jgi:drug/metabolite transporter (DMT)-like permease